MEGAGRSGGGACRPARRPLPLPRSKGAPGTGLRWPGAAWLSSPVPAPLPWPLGAAGAKARCPRPAWLLDRPLPPRLLPGTLPVTEKGSLRLKGSGTYCCGFVWLGPLPLLLALLAPRRPRPIRPNGSGKCSCRCPWIGLLPASPLMLGTPGAALLPLGEAASTAPLLGPPPPRVLGPFGPNGKGTCCRCLLLGEPAATPLLLFSPLAATLLLFGPSAAAALPPTLLDAFAGRPLRAKGNGTYCLGPLGLAPLRLGLLTAGRLGLLAAGRLGLLTAGRLGLLTAALLLLGPLCAAPLPGQLSIAAAPLLRLSEPNGRDTNCC